MAQPKYDGQSFSIVTKSGKIHCNVDRCAEGLYCCDFASGSFLFAAVDDFGNLRVVPGSYHGESVYHDRTLTEMHQPH